MDHRSSSRSRVLNFAFQQAVEVLADMKESALFVAPDGQVCLHVAPKWNELLAAISRLGPLGIVTSNDEMRQAVCVPGADLTPVPSGGGWIDLANSGEELVLEPSDWLFALAVEERMAPGTLFGFQFFDYQALGQMKILLTNESSLDGFVEIASRFAGDGTPPRPVAVEPTSAPLSAQPGVVPDDDVRGLWPLTRHDVPGRFFPGLHGVTRQAALRVVGHQSATPMESKKLVEAILDARRKRLRLRCTLFNRQLVHSIEITPRRLERCPHFLYVFDEAAEIHVPLNGVEIWRLWHAEGCSFSVDLLTQHDERLALIEGW